MGAKPTKKKHAVKKQNAVNKSAVSVSTQKLTQKQDKFCRYIAAGYSATQAAIKAGYSKHTAKQTASENLAKPYLKAIISQNAEKQKENFENDFEYTNKAHFEELCEMQELAKKRGDLQTALKAAVQKGKLCGLYVEKVETTIKEPRRFVFEVKK